MTQITFHDGDQPYLMMLEVLDDCCRIVIIERDEDTGARFVRDIIQCGDKNLAHELEVHADLFGMNILTDLRMPFDHDLGRASTLKGWCKKIQAHVQDGRQNNET